MPVIQIFDLKCDICDCHIHWTEGQIPYGCNAVNANLPPDWTLIITGGNKGARLICYKHNVDVTRSFMA